MSSDKHTLGIVEAIMKRLERAGLGLTQLESIERALLSNSPEATQRVHDLVNMHTSREASLADSVVAFISACQTASARVESVLERAVLEIENEILQELLDQ